jgi:hypothetical protein
MPTTLKFKIDISNERLRRKQQSIKTTKDLKLLHLKGRGIRPEEIKNHNSSLMEKVLLLFFLD